MLFIYLFIGAALNRAVQSTVMASISSKCDAKSNTGIISRGASSIVCPDVDADENMEINMKFS